MRILTILFAAALFTAAPPMTAAETTTTVGLIVDKPEDARPIGEGAAAPNPTVRNTAGEDVELASIYPGGPTLLIFYRGGWCPYCNTHLGKLATIEDDLRALGVRIVAISADSPEYAAETQHDKELPWPIYSDMKAEAMRAFGLAFRVPDEMVERYKTKYKIDLEKHAGGETHHALPIPAAYLIATDGTIKFAYSSPDYQNRVDEKKVLSKAKELFTPPAQSD